MPIETGVYTIKIIDSLRKIFLRNYNCLNQARKTTMTRRTTVSRLHDGSIEAPLKPLEHHSTMVPRGSRWTLNWTPIMPRDASLSSRCKFSRRTSQKQNLVDEVRTLEYTYIYIYVPNDNVKRSVPRFEPLSMAIDNVKRSVFKNLKLPKVIHVYIDEALNENL